MSLTYTRKVRPLKTDNSHATRKTLKQRYFGIQSKFQRGKYRQLCIYANKLTVALTAPIFAKSTLTERFCGHFVCRTLSKLEKHVENTKKNLYLSCKVICAFQSTDLIIFRHSLLHITLNTFCTKLHPSRNTQTMPKTH